MFNPGDIVLLKSGGPEMTIFRSVRGDLRTYVCLWLEAAESSKRRSFTLPF